MYTILRTDEFDGWLSKLRDAKGKARIAARIRSAEMGNLGDVEPVGDGDKSSQSRDIKKAKALASALKE